MKRASISIGKARQKQRPRCPYCDATLSYEEMRDLLKEMPEDRRRWLRASLAASIRPTYNAILKPSITDEDRPNAKEGECPHCGHKLTFAEIYDQIHLMSDQQRRSLYASLSAKLRKTIGLGTGRPREMDRPRCKCRAMTLTRFQTRKRCYGCERLQDLMKKGMTLKQARAVIEQERLERREVLRNSKLNVV
jgi:uncharacterized Zn-finger protein